MPELSPRRVVGWCTVSIDGFSSGRRGPQYDTWLHETVMKPHAEAYFESVWRAASTVVMGRNNAEGFGEVWPDMAVSPELSESSRAYGRFLVEVEKIGFSRTLPATGLDRYRWTNARVASDLESEIRSLRDQAGGDIIVQNSASIIQQLIRADLLDDLRLVIVPIILGDGLRLLGELQSAEELRWELAECTTFADGSIGVHYTRQRT